MTIQRLRPDALVGTPFDYATIYPFMGLNEGGNNIMAAPVGPQWPYQGVFGMGYYLYGTNLNTSFLGGWNTGSPAGSDAAKVQAKEDIQVTWANRVLPWFEASPASDNTCTNAAIRILNGQCYIKLTSTGRWYRADTGTYNTVKSTRYTIGTTSDGATSLLVITDQSNIPAFPFCPTPSDWDLSSSSDTTKYKVQHASANARIVLADPSDVAGVFCTFESQLIPTKGSSLNGAPKFLVKAGIDAGYNNDAIGSGLLNGAPYSPLIASSGWFQANNDGTRRTHYVGTFLHANSYQDLTSYYSTHGGISVLTAAQFQANMPTRVYQAPL